MKITLPNSTTILIREEDFLEISVSEEEISYNRPNGTRALIKLLQTTLNPKINAKNHIPVALRKKEQITTLEQNNTNSGMKWRQQHSKQHEDLPSDMINQINELRNQVSNISTSIKSDLSNLFENRVLMQEGRLQDQETSLQVLESNLKTWMTGIAEKILEMETKITETETDPEKAKEESKNQLYSDVIDYCLKISPAAEPGDYPDEEIKRYILSCIKNSTLTLNREGDGLWNSTEDQRKITRLFKKYRKKGLPTD